MPMYKNAETGLPEYRLEIDTEDEHEGVVALTKGDPRNPDSDEDDDFDKREPPYEAPEGDPEDNDQPSGDPESDEHVPPANKAPPRHRPSEPA